jgi:Zn-dependent protease with chaperone function
LSLSFPIVGYAQQALATREVPEKFSLDRKTAARLRPELLAQSNAPTGRYAIGLRVFEKLVQQLPSTTSRGYSWQLRIVKDGQINASSSADGTIFVESGLADLADKTAGLWASVLSHEISHVVRRDWARRPTSFLRCTICCTRRARTVPFHRYLRCIRVGKNGIEN